MNAKKTPKPPWTLQEWREARNYSKSELARLLGCGRASIDNWENGATDTPRYIQLACIAIERGVVVDGMEEA
jgi:transcriptional regulator with XRE-family HTH domain